MRIVELILNEENIDGGVNAISIVEQPAIESDFIALSKEQEINLAEVDQEKRILLGPALIPNKQIFRKNGDDEFYVYFSKDTIRKASQLFLKSGNQSKSTLEHEMKLSGLTVVESWIVEDNEKDKSAFYGLSVPVGTWMVAVKVDNEEVWTEFVKTKKVKGFSIEGYFADKTELAKVDLKEELAAIEKAEAEYILEQVKALINDERVEMESYSDYPDAVKNNAKRGLELNENQNNKCATQVGKVRAQQLAKGEAVSTETIKRMYSYLSRAGEYYDENDTQACGTISYLLWGGKAALRWAESKLKEIEKDA
jgi:hypothetical protein